MDTNIQRDCDLTTSTCVNNIGGFECLCKPGFKHDDAEGCVGEQGK